MNKETKLKYGIYLSFIFMIIEIIGGYFSNSLAIYSDAAHLLTDISGFAISLIALTYSKKSGTKYYTYGLARIEILGALVSLCSLWFITFNLVLSSCSRILLYFEGKMENVNGQLMFYVSLFGICVNICLAIIFYDDHNSLQTHEHSYYQTHTHTQNTSTTNECKKNDINNESTFLLNTQRNIIIDEPSLNIDFNIEAQYIHILADLAQSISVTIASLICWFIPILKIVDPLISLIFSIFVIKTTIPLVTRVVNIFVEGTPTHLDWNDIEYQLKNINGVVDVHDLHIWSLSTFSYALSVHIRAKGNQKEILTHAFEVCKEFQIYHSTIQLLDANIYDSCVCEQYSNNQSICHSNTIE